jgi:ubiquinone biosynthesis protein
MVSIVHAARDLGRIRDISRVLVRHGFGEVVGRLGLSKAKREDNGAPASAPRASIGARVRGVLTDLGPSFVKLGQIVSTRSDVLPKDVLRELKQLQDNVPPVAFEQIREQVEKALGAPLEEVFEDFDKRPLAAASIAQVHRATLKTPEGKRDVVVKVQRPGIAHTVASDLDLLHTFAALLEHAIPESRIYSPVALVQQFDRAITSELDFTTEAENALRFSENFRGFEGAYFPLVYKQASSKHVLTLEFLDGLKIEDAVRQGFDGHRLARMAMAIVIKQVFDDGFFHADPHPGNVLILGTAENPTYALFDLGMVGRLGPRMRDLTIDLMVAAARRDYDGVADAMYGIANATKKIDMVAYRSEVALLAERYLGKQLKDIELSSLVYDLVSTATRYGLEVPPDFMLVGKALITLEGVGKEIAPDFDILKESQPFFLELLKKRYSPERIGNELLRRVEKLSGATTQLPEQLQEILDDLRFGRFAVRITDTELRSSADRLGRRLFVAVVGSAWLLAGTWMLSQGMNYLGATFIVLSLLAVSFHVMRDAYGNFRRPK